MHEYLNQKDYRYEETVKRHDFSGKNVVDLCSGNTRLYELVKVNPIIIEPQNKS